MRILAAMDKFKGTLTAAEAARLVAEGFRRAGGRFRVEEWPLADGGEGTCEALTAARGGRYRTVRVHGPLGEPVEARYGLAGTTAFMEMATACGLALVPVAQRDPRRTSTFGFGEMLADAIRQGATDIIAGIGGSATNDGGAGMAAALGVRFLDAAGRELPWLCGGKLAEVADIDRTGVLPALAGVRIRIASDVTNPLLGERGAAAVYAPQKGADAAAVRELEAGLAHLRELADADAAHPLGRPGDGAAGGLGFGCRVFLHTDFASGAQLVMRETGFLQALAEAEPADTVVVTGEGCTDAQTGAGKLCAEVAAAARAHGVRCVLLSGGLGCPRGELLDTYDAAFAAGVGRRGLPDILAHAAEDLRDAACALARLL